MNLNYVTERSETPSGLKHITKRRGWKAAYCHLGLKTVKVIVV
jgi:hypothetical protein